MKTLLSIFIFIGFMHSSYALNVHEITVSSINNSDINIHLKTADAYVFEYYNHHYEIVGQTIHLNVCYLPYLLPAVSFTEKDFVIPDINTNNQNFTLIVNVYMRRMEGTAWVCNSTANMDSKSLQFSTPLTNSVTLATPEFNTDLMSFYPNPTTGIINFNKNIHRLEIYDNVGRKVKMAETFSNPVDLSHLNDGIYFITVFSETGSWTKKVILEK